MNIDISKIRKGDQIQVANGDWFEVINNDHESQVELCILIKPPGKWEWWVLNSVITGHKPKPEPEVFEWINVNDVRILACSDNGQAMATNKFLTAKYGKPVSELVRVANGDEDDGDAIALSWDDLDKCWEVCVVSDLRIGEPYILQSDLPKGNSDVHSDGKLD